MVGSLGGLVRLADEGGGVERDAGVCVPLSLGEADEDDESLFTDDERAWVTCVSSFGVPWGTGEMDPATSLSSTGVPWSGFSLGCIPPAGIVWVGRVQLSERASWSPAESVWRDVEDGFAYRGREHKGLIGPAAAKTQ